MENSGNGKMEMKYCGIKDLKNATIPELKKEIERLTGLSEFYDGKQLAQKLFLNASYGSVASKFFEMHNRNVAEAITLQGQDLNHFSENCMNRFFTRYLPKQIDFLKKYNPELKEPVIIDLSEGRLTENKPLNLKEPAYSHLESNYSATVIGDTDSIYVEFGRIANQLGIPIEKQAEFSVDVWNNFGAGYMQKCYDAYAKYYNCDKNLELLELEKISRTVIAIQKKHYAIDKCWEEPGIFLEPLSHISYTGVEVVQGGTPSFIRKCHKDFYKFIFQKYIKNEKPQYSEIVSKFQKYKKDFKQRTKSSMKKDGIDEICKATGMNNYEKYILDDKNSVTVELHTPVTCKAAAYYNHDLYKKKSRMEKYMKIKSGDKIRWYYTTDKSRPVYAFLPYNYPSEFAPEIDIDTEFEKLILEPLNNIVSILGYRPLNSKLCYENSLF